MKKQILECEMGNITGNIAVYDSNAGGGKKSKDNVIDKLTRDNWTVLVEKLQCLTGKKVILEEYKLLSLEELKKKYPNMIFTLDKKTRGYFARADIKTQGGKVEYLGAIKGQVSYEDGLKFLNNQANSNYDKFY